MILSVKKLFYRTIDSIKDFNKNPISNLGFLIPIAMSLTSIISAVVGYIIFIAKGGYSTQFLHIKQSGIDGITKSFTTGTSGFLTGGIVLKIVFFLFLAQLVVMLIAYFLESGKAKKILMIIDLSLLGLVIIVSVVVFLIANGSIEVYQDQLILVLNSSNKMFVNAKAIIIIYGILTLLSFVAFIVLVVISKCRWMLGYSVLCLVFNFIVMPLIILLIENIIPLVLGIIVLVFIAGMIYLIFKVILSGNSEQREIKFDVNTLFWRDTGNYVEDDIVSPSVDCIYFKNTYYKKKYVCTVREYEKGEVAIINVDIRIMDIAGCNTPIM